MRHPLHPSGKALKILIYGLNYWPEPVGVGKFTAEMAECLAAAGHRVSVITAPQHYPEWRIPPPYAGGARRRETTRGVQVTRAALWLPRRLTPLKRILACIGFACSSLVPLLKAAARRPDVIVAIEPTFFTVPGALLVSKLFRIPLWLHIQDFELEAARALDMVRGHGLLRVMYALEGWLMRRMSRVSTLDPRMDLRLQAMGVAAARRRQFPNWVDCQQIAPRPGNNALRRDWGLDDSDRVFLYSGSMGKKHGLESIVELARQLQPQRSIRFVLCGEGIERARLQEASRDLTNLRWMDLQPVERLNELLNAADVHLLPQRPGIADAVLPSKLTGMLASGRPVIATAVPGTTLAKVAGEAGLVVPPDDLPALAEAVLRLSQDDALRQRLGAAGRRYAEEHFDRDAILARFAGDLALAVREHCGDGPSATEHVDDA